MSRPCRASVVVSRAELSLPPETHAELASELEPGERVLLFDRDEVKSLSDVTHVARQLR